MWRPTGLIPWFSKTEGNTYATLAASSLPLRGKPTQAQDVARRISGAVAGESTQKVNIPSTHHNPDLSHYIICHLPLLFLSPQFTLAILFALSLSILPLYLPLFARLLLFARMVGIVIYLLLNREPKIYGSSSAC